MRAVYAATAARVLTHRVHPPETVRVLSGTAIIGRVTSATNVAASRIHASSSLERLDEVRAAAGLHGAPMTRMGLDRPGGSGPRKPQGE